MRQLGTKLESHQTCHNLQRDQSPPEPPQVWPPRSARCRRQLPLGGWEGCPVGTPPREGRIVRLHWLDKRDGPFPPREGLALKLFTWTAPVLGSYGYASRLGCALFTWPTLARSSHFHVSDPSAAPLPNQWGLIWSLLLQVRGSPLAERARRGGKQSRCSRRRFASAPRHR